MMRQNFVNGDPADVRDHLAELPNCRPPISLHCFFAIGPSTKPMAARNAVRHERPCLNPLHHLRTRCMPIRFSPCVSHGWKWMSPGAVSFAREKRIAQSAIRARQAKLVRTPPLTAANPRLSVAASWLRW